MKVRRAALPALLLTGALTTAAAAEHAVAYRYTVLGYVTDGDGRALPGVRVELSREKTGFSRRPLEGPTLFTGTLKRFLAQ